MDKRNNEGLTMDLIKATIRAHLKHLGLRADKEKSVWKGDTMLFSNTIVEAEQEQALFYWLEGYSSCHDNHEEVN